MRTLLARNIVANAVSAGLQIAAALLSVPIILSGVGLRAYGVWTLAQGIVLFLGTADAGIGPAVQRFCAVAAGAGDLAQARRVAWTAVGFYSVVGTLGLVLGLLVGPSAVGLFNVAEPLRDDAAELFQVAGLILLLAFVGAGLNNVLVGLERFLAAAVTSALGGATFLVALPVLLSTDLGLVGVGYAAALQQGAIAVTRLFAVRDLLGAGRPAVVTRDERRAIVDFSLRLQVNLLATLINSQTDKLVVGAIASSATLGQLGIAAQVTDAGRLLAGAALAPMSSRLAQAAGAGAGALDPLYRGLQRRWTTICLGGTLIGMAALPALIVAWLGDGYEKAIALGAVLVAGYGVQLLTGPGTSYLRAINRLRPEVELGLIVVGANVVLTVAGGLAFGAMGVVAATATAYTIGTAWFFASARRWLPQMDPFGGRELRHGARATLAAAVALGAGLGLTAALPTGVALVPVGAVGGAAFGVFVAGVVGWRPLRPAS